MALPSLTKEEKINALQKAQEMRTKRNQMRQQLKKGNLSLEDILSKIDDEVVSRMRVLYLLESLPKIGKITAKKIMEDIGIDDSRRIQGLGSRQKDALIERLAK